MTTDPAVTAAAEAITDSRNNMSSWFALWTARRAVAAARPIIETEVRARIADEIEATGHPDGFHRDGMTRDEAAAYCSCCSWAVEHADIARGQS